MGKIIHHEFVGNRLLFFLVSITLIGIPIAVIYLLEGLVTIEDEVADPSAFMESYRRKRA